MGSTVTISITGDSGDATIKALAAAIAGGTSGGGTSTGTSSGTNSGGSTATPGFTESVNGSVVLGPPAVDGAKSGAIVDQFGDTFQLQYSAAAEYTYVLVNGSSLGTISELYYIDHQVWAVNGAENTVWLWQGGKFVQQSALPPVPNGPVIQNPAPPPPPAGSVTVTGATPVAATATGMADAIKAAVAGTTITLKPGIYTETAIMAVPMTIEGAGIGTTTVNCQGITPTQQKAILVPGVAGDLIAQMSLTGAAIDNGAGGNAAGVRDAGDGIGFTLDTVEIFGCQMGCLTFASPIVIKNSHIHDNGNATAPAGTHNLYVGAGTLDLENSVVAHCSHEHEVKSRAKTTTVAGCTITTGGHGKCLDICDGGAVTVSSTTLALGKAASDQDLGFFDYGTESLNNGIGAITFDDVCFDSSAVGQGGLLIIGSFAPNATIAFTGNCTWKGFAPQFQGIAVTAITGTITKAA